MQTTGNLKRKLIVIIILALTLLGSGTTLAASADAPAADGAKQTADSVLMLREIDRRLARMTPEELAATLKLLRINQLLKDSYVGDIDGQALLTGAVKGEVAALGDPYSTYMDPKVYREFLISTKGSFSGVGIELGVRDKKLTVIAPIEGTPADKAGLASGDLILKIDGRETKEMSLEEAVNLIRGPEGVDVTLTIGRDGETKDYTINRAKIQLKSVSGKMLEGGIGYIRLSIFNKNTGDEFAAKLQELENEGMQALILDLRNNPGGLLQECVRVADNFIPEGKVVSVVTRDGSRETAYSHLPAAKYPLVVLVNGGSASASEIVAGAVQDTGAGTLVGTKTFGKGSVQTLTPLGDGSAVKITIAKYLTPKDRSINGTGLEPDVVVEAPKGAGSRDLQLDKAIEIIKEKLQK